MVYVAKTAVRLRSRPDWCFTKCHSGPRPKKNCCRRLCMVKMKSLLQKGNFGHQTSTRTIGGQSEIASGVIEREKAVIQLV